ncbi:MAG TPA: universal stress protein [Conexibacter sp.]|nr:universal stress protein [Conexibacter sp.]
MLRKVLVGVDGTSSARDAVVLARALAADGDPDVVLVGAYADPLLPFPPGLRRELHLGQEVERLLLDVREQLAPTARTHVKADRSPGRALCHELERERADLLVVGSSRRVDAGRAGAGRTGRQVLHGAACAVAVAAHGVAGAAPLALRRLVVGVERSPESDAALALARSLAEAAGAELLAVAVADDRLPATVAPAGMAVELVQWDEVVEAHRSAAERLLAELTGRIPELSVELRAGDPAEELAAAAAGADLLVLGSRRWGPLARLVLGSTGQELVRDAPCSLLLVPRPAEEAPTDSSVDH